MTKPLKKPSTPLRLLEAVPNTNYSRLIVRYPYQDDNHFAFAYHEAATRLASTYTGQPIDDTMLLPFLSLYRQAFELRLKEVVRSLAFIRRRYYEGGNPELAYEAIEKRLKDDLGHNLYKLLNELLKHYGELDLDQEFPESTKKLIILLHDADNSGTAFRYAGGLPETQEYADFPNLVGLLDQELKLLGAVEDWITEGFAHMPDPEDFY